MFAAQSRAWTGTVILLSQPEGIYSQHTWSRGIGPPLFQAFYPIPTCPCPYPLLNLPQFSLSPFHCFWVCLLYPWCQPTSCLCFPTSVFPLHSSPPGQAFPESPCFLLSLNFWAATRRVLRAQDRASPGFTSCPLAGTITCAGASSRWFTRGLQRCWCWPLTSEWELHF